MDKLLTEAIAIDRTIETWEPLAERGCGKEDLDWSKYDRKPVNGCWLCDSVYEYSLLDCRRCPYFKKFGKCNKIGAPYLKWTGNLTIEDKKKYASQVLEHLKQLKEDKQDV